MKACRFWGWIFLVSFLLISAPDTAVAAVPGKIVIAQGVDVKSLDPHKISSAVDVNACLALYDGLLRRTGRNELAPNLAKDYRAIDPTTWEFTIREKVLFHDGTPLTAGDVVFSLNRLRDPTTNSPFRSLFTGIGDVTAKDLYTVRVTTEKPDPILPNRLAFAAFIVPEKYLREKGDDYFARHPVGTGRYRFVKRTAGESLELEANDRYWGEKPAAIGTLVFRKIADPEKRVEALKKGEVHIAAAVPPDRVFNLGKDPAVDVVSGTGGRIIFIGFNLLRPETGPLSDKRVRQAINHAIDRKELIEKTLLGSGKGLSSPLHSGVFGHDPAFPPHSFDPEKARKLLSEAGYPEGFEIELATPEGRYILDRQVADAVAGMLGKVGIRTRVKAYEWLPYKLARESREVEPLYLLGWGNALYDADGVLMPLFSSGAFNATYASPELDRLLMDARFEMDPEKRRALYGQCLRHIREEAPAAFLYEQLETYGVRKSVRNFSPPDGNERMDCDRLELKGL